MNTRNGKIARLPRETREELNRRLENGCTGLQLLDWLNSLPEVQSLLQAEFNGQPINEQNITNWRQGGYLDWLQGQEARDQIHLMLEHYADLELDGIDGRLSDRLATIAAVELARQLRQLNVIEDPAERWKKFQELSREICRFQTRAHHASHLQLRWSKWEEEQHEKEAARAKEQARDEFLLDFLHHLPKRPKTEQINPNQPKSR